MASLLYHVVVQYVAVLDTVRSGIEAPAGGLLEDQQQGVGSRPFS